jgi:transketolase N-terminal domain/subunit
VSSQNRNINPPTEPKSLNRDRFVLSNGHGSTLFYAFLHLTGYDLPLDELKHFHQLHGTPAIQNTSAPTTAKRQPPPWPGRWQRPIESFNGMKRLRRRVRQ